MGDPHAWREALADVSLTERELEVLHLKAKRRTNAEIAGQLFISITTVKWHVRQIYNKLGANNRAEAVASARQLGLLDQKPEQTKSRHDNLPTPLTPFVGREREIAHLTRTLADPGRRLVTVIGPGGIGKTRLALQVASLNDDRFTDGVCWVSFSAQDATEFVFATADEYMTATLSAALDLSAQGDEDPRHVLTTYLRNREILIILDAFEHLLPHTSFVSELLADTTACTFLITSRERLNAPGEVLFPVQGLALTQEQSADPADAVNLFLVTAGRVSKDEPLAASELPVIQRICQRLEGMPLAIELAAEWTRLLPVIEIEQELYRGLEFLDIGSSSIRTVIDRSWNQLTDHQRTSFARLAIFQRGFTRDAARKVAGAGLRTLTALFDKSLIQRTGKDRYTLHDLLRQYAAEQLGASGEYESIGDAHCAYFATLAAGQMEPLYRGDHSGMLADLDNLRAAWRWAVKRLRLEDLRKMLFPMGWFYDLRAYYPESVAAIRLAVDALRMPEPQGLQGIVYGKALAARGLSERRLHGADYAEPSLRQGLEILRRLGAREDLAWPQILWVPHDGALADPKMEDRYEQYCLESLEIFEDLNDSYGIAFCLAVLGSHYLQLGRNAEAKLNIERGHAISHSLGDQEGMAHALRRLGHLNLHLGHYDIARDNFQEEFGLWRGLSLPRLAAEALRSLGETYLAEADFEKADEVLKESLSSFEQVGDEGNALFSLLDLVELALRQSQPQVAQRLLRQARPLADRRQRSEVQALWWLLSGRVYLHQNDLETVNLALDRALEYSIQAGGLMLTETILDFALLYRRLGEDENAARLLGFAQAQTGLPAVLVQGRLEPLRESLATVLDNDSLALLYAEGAALGSEEVANSLLTEISDAHNLRLPGRPGSSELS